MCHLSLFFLYPPSPFFATDCLSPRLSFKDPPHLDGQNGADVFIGVAPFNCAPSGIRRRHVGAPSTWSGIARPPASDFSPFVSGSPPLQRFCVPPSMVKSVIPLEPVLLLSSGISRCLPCGKKASLKNPGCQRRTVPWALPSSSLVQATHTPPSTNHPNTTPPPPPPPPPLP